MKRESRNLIIGVVIGFILGLIVGFLIFDKDNLDCHYYCDINLDEVGCASNYDCLSVNGICDLNKYKCVSPNINFDMYFSGGKEECLNVGGNWDLGLG